MVISKNLFTLNSPLLFVELMTILLLTYIAYGEVNRKFEEFQLGKMASQAEIIQNAMDSHLQAGIPLEQFGGFQPLSEALLQSDSYIQQIKILDTQSDPVFTKKASIHYNAADYTEIVTTVANAQLHFWKSITEYKVTLPLAGKFGVVGSIELEVSRNVVQQPITEQFTIVAYISAIIFVVFTILVLTVDLLGNKYARIFHLRKNLLNFFYLVSFMAISAVIASSVFTIYEQGASAKIAALSEAMGQRINAIMELGIQPDDIDGINDAFQQYQSNNPEISAVALSRNGTAMFHTDSSAVDIPYVTPPDSFEYRQKLQVPNSSANWELAITIPVAIVNNAIYSRVDEFLVLMLACGLISWIFLDAGTGLTQWVHNKGGMASKYATNNNFELGLRLVKPAYFLIVFTSALPVTFLPQLVTNLAGDPSAGSIASATLPFTIYYFVFAAVLIPAGRYAEKVELKSMMAVGFVTELIGLICIALTDDFWLLTIGRIFSGFAQGVFLIGLNSYTLSITPREKRTQGAAVKVNGRNAALVSGTSIGALLYAYVDYHTVFIIAAAISMVGIFYLWRLVPSVNEIIAASAVAKVRKPEKSSTLHQDLIAVVRDGEFMKTLVFIGLVSKMAITGVIMFAIPLILSEKGVAAEDIGQSVMIYYIASIVITRVVSARVDATGASQMILISSSLIGGIGILLIGITGITQWQFDIPFPGFEYLVNIAITFNLWLSQFGELRLENYLILAGIVLAGISNGMMAAPIMTHIDKTNVAHQYGNKTVAATYLFLERGGHVFGPMIISFMLLFTYQTTLGIALFGIITMFLSIVFMMTSRQR